MSVIRQPDGTILVPTRAEEDEVIGDAMLPLTPEHPLYEEWMRWLAEHPLQEFRYEEALHPRGRGGRWIPKLWQRESGTRHIATEYGRASFTSNLTPETKQALLSYETSAYHAVNEQLRGLAPEDRSAIATHRGERYQPTVGEVIDGMDAAIASARVHDDVTVYRGARAEAFQGASPGDEIVDDGFVSTSLREDTARIFTEAGQSYTIAEIRVPSGTHAMSIDQTGTGLSAENEVLLERGSRFRVIDYTPGTGRDPNRITLEVAAPSVQEARYEERLHPRGRGGRWVQILGKLKTAKMDDITDIEGHSVIRTRGGYSVRVGTRRMESEDPEKVADAIEQHLDYRSTLGEPVTLAVMDEKLNKWFTPDPLEGGREKHPRSGYEVQVGKWRSPVHPEPDVDGPAEYQVLDYGEHAGDQFGPKKAGTEPIRRVYRGMTTDEYKQAVKRGYVQSDMRGVIASWEGTNAAVDPRSGVSYLPRGREGVIVQMDVRPEEKWFTRNEDSYLRTRERIPISRISAVSPVLYKDDDEGLFEREPLQAQDWS